jgi:translation initiation factor 2-alpha kinase 4
MAWQASGAWNSPINNGRRHDNTSFPGLQPTSPDATTKIEYAELQQNELLALEAIYGDDFIKHSDTHSAWKVPFPVCPARHRTLAHLE